ncbi:MAG: hypothetical protein JNL40_07210 [Cyclobacteriaceae bacterium]|nr:hypothetical protein [Cyclobacteriaceae bacterium]
MGQFRFTLETYSGSKTKFRCPQCGKRTFTKYIDTETSEYLNDTVGRCDREGKCSYHYKPKQYFIDNGVAHKNVFLNGTSSTSPTPKVYFPMDLLKKSRKSYSKNSFVSHLLTLFDSETVELLIQTYQLGTSSGQWPGACVFWFIDIQGRVHAGQVKLFLNGHTAKYSTDDGENHSCTTWVHSILARKSFPHPDWLAKYIQQEKKVTCFFGEHLLQNSKKPIAIVEAPATAIIASVYLPMYTWLASGSLSYLTPRRCEVLKGKKVVLFPDLNAYLKWKPIADQLGFSCSSMLELNATESQKAQGLDIRDFLEKFRISEFMATDHLLRQGNEIES